MPRGEYTAVNYYPAHLYQAEIQNPYSVFHSFFDAFPLPDAMEFIDSWLAVLSKNYYWKNGYPARLLYFYEIMVRLTEAAYLVNQMDSVNEAAILPKEDSEQDIDLMNLETYCGHQAKYSPWDYFPRCLTKKQFINPYLAFKKFFKYKDLPAWKDELYDLLYNAFIGKNKIEIFEYDLLMTQKHLKRMVEAAHLVEVRTGVKIKKNDASENDRE